LAEWSYRPAKVAEQITERSHYTDKPERKLAEVLFPASWLNFNHAGKNYPIFFCSNSTNVLISAAETWFVVPLD
jgi:hypothetical protein